MLRMKFSEYIFITPVNQVKSSSRMIPFATRAALVVRIRRITS